MYKRLLSLMTLVIVLMLISDVALATAPFYEGKVMQIVVGAPAGGGFDAYARLVARHMAKYIPGHPTIIVVNMPGAGFRIAANHLYRVAKPDGLAMGHIHAGIFWAQLFGDAGVEFDAPKYEYVGAATKEENVVVLTKASGITNMDKWMNSKTPVKFAADPGYSSLAIVPRILRAALGLPIRVISGYKGGPDIRLAMEGGEVDGFSLPWDSVKIQYRKALETGDVVVLLQIVPKPFPDLPNVPLAIDFAKTDEARQLIEVGIHSPSIYGRPFVLPPGTPRAQVQILQTAFQETLKDKDFLAEGQKARMRIAPVSGEDLIKHITGFFKMEPTLVTKLKDSLTK